MYQPFELVGANGSHVIVFFRDTQISDELTSTWNYIANPRVAASDFIAAVAEVYRESPGGVLTIASDGENPIALGDKLISALDFDAIFGAIESQSWLQTSTLGSIVASRQVSARLTYLPNASWSGGFGLWIGSPPKDAIWDAIIQSRKTLVNLTAQYGVNSPEIQELWNYLYVAEGSDWEWQTPSGPAWFAMQGLRYADAAAQYKPQAEKTMSALPSYSIDVGVAAAASLAAGVVLVLWRRKKP
jgi:alpha-amylase/alpha-mannosidase (GH57 family)